MLRETVKKAFEALRSGKIIPDPTGRDFLYRYVQDETYPRGALRGRDLRPLMALERQAAKYPNAPFARQYRSHND